MRQWLKNHSVAVYVVLANALTWLCWIPTLLIAQRRGYVLPSADGYALLARDGFQDARHVAVSIVFFLAVYGPLVAGLVAVWLDAGRVGIAALLRRVVKWRIQAKWYLIAIGINVLMFVITLGLGILIGALPPRSVRLAPIPYLVLNFLAQLLTSGLGEEPGWRGFLLPKLQERHATGKATWLLGLIWAIWHYPFLVYYTLASAQGMPAIALVIAVLSGLAGNTMSLIGMSYFYTWMHNHTKSVFLAILFHALNNMVPLLLAGGMPATLRIVVGVVPWILVFIFGRIAGKARFPGEPA